MIVVSVMDALVLRNKYKYSNTQKTKCGQKEIKMGCSNFFQELKTEFLKNFSRSFLRSNENNYFLAIGRPLPWSRDNFSEVLNFEDNFYAQFDGGSGGLTGDDLVIPEITNTQKNKSTYRIGNILVKRAKEENFSFLVPNYTWTKGETYDAYDDTQNLFNPRKKFFVFNKYDNGIYKCLENASGASSTIDPEESYTEGSFLLDDGYRWKLIYRVSNADKVKFSVDSGDELAESYVPVKIVDFNYNLNETEQIQYDIQTSAIPGAIESIAINPDYKDHITFDSEKCTVDEDYACAVYSNGSSGDTEVEIVACGSLTSHPHEGPNVWTKYLTGLVFNVVSGVGVGQRRIIKESIREDPNVSRIKLSLESPLDHGISGFSGSTPLSFFTIEPQIRVYGDGTSITSGNTFGNSHLTRAELKPVFEALLGDQTKTLSNIDIINTGRDYSRVKVEFVSGITHHYPNDTGTTLADKITTFNTNTKNFLRPILPPEGGHGSNPLLEMGCDKMLFRVDLDSDESGIISAENDFRQISLIKNPLFNDPITQLRFVEAGTDQLVVGNIVQYNDNQGTISKIFNFSGNAGNEIFVTGISGSFRGATFVYISQEGDDGITFTIDPFDGFREYRIAGSENRNNLILEVETTESGTYFPRDILIGLGSSENATYSSLASGVIRDVKTVANKRIFTLEDVQGTFRVGEKIGVVNKPTNEGVSTLQVLNNSKVLSYRYSRENYRDSYSTLTKVVLDRSVGTNFTDGMFYEDQPVYSFTSSQLDTNLKPTGEVFGSGHLFTWGITASDAKVTLELVGAKKGSFREGDYIPYYYTINGGVIFGTISDVQEADIEYDSGEILYTQNFEPIERSVLSKEEVSLVLGL